jgi:hypothetical protein
VNSCKYFFIYDSSIWEHRSLVFFLRLITEAELNFISRAKLVKNFGIEKTDKMLSQSNLTNADHKIANRELLFMIDFNIDEEFEVLDESFIPNVSDKRIYTGKTAIKKCLLFSPYFRKFIN